MRIEGMDSTIKTGATMKTAEVNMEPKKLTNENHNGNNTNEDTQEKVSLPFLRKAIDKANETMQFQNRQLQFRIHEKTKEIMVKIIDSETKEVIREIPPEKLLDMFASMLELAGLLVDERR